jgi:tetratricopeptide (TPR) repeat protein
MNRIKTALPFLIGSGLFTAAFITYLFTLCPSIYFGDSGELVSMILTLGIPHPTGFPLYILGGKLFSFLPLASPAFRVNLMSAFFGALVPVLLFFAARFYSKKKNDSFTGLYLPFAAALLFIFSYTLWSQAVIARIYSLNAFFCAFALMLFMYYTEASPSKKALYLLALVTGLGAGLHLSFVIFSGILWLYLLIKYWKILKNMLVPLSAFMLIGGSVYLYITIRGGSDAVLKWADLNSFDSLKNYFSQAQYKIKMFTRDSRGYGYFFDFIKSVCIREFSWFGLFLFLFGAAWSVQKGFKYFWPFMLIFISNIFTLAVYGNYTDMPLAFRYMIPSYIISVFFIFLFCSYIYETIKNKKTAAASAVACIALAFLASFPINNYENDRSSNYIAHAYPFDLLSPLPEKSCFFTSGDNQIYTMAYAKFILGKFSGITVYDQIDSIFKDIRALWAEAQSKSLSSNLITVLARSNTTIYTTTLPGNPAIGNSAAGLVYRLYDGSSGPDDLLPWRLYSLKGILREAGTFHTYEEREVVSSYYYRMAQYYKKSGNSRLYAYLLDRAASTGYDSSSSLGNIAIIWSTDYETTGAPQKADELFKKAISLDPQNELLYFNSGSFFARIEDWEKASLMFTKTIELNPANMMARVYLARIQEEAEKKKNLDNQLIQQALHYNKAKEYFTNKEYSRALDEFSRDIELNPGLDRSYFHIGLIHSVRNDIEKAIPFYEKAVKNNKNNVSALNNLGLCYLKLNKKALAKEVFIRSLQVDPVQERVKKLVEDIR